jgi:hypothetical protein
MCGYPHGFLPWASSLCAIISDVRLVAIIAVAYVLGLNCTVRHFGGDAFPLSVVRLPEKTQAVLLLGAHSVKHLWNSHCDDPRQFVIDAARERGIPISFALSIARTESNFRSHSISSTGAMGVMQLMPTTARENGVIDPFDPEQNARGAATFLESLWKRYRGNRMRIAAAYNAGPARVAQTGAMKLPKETQGYAKRVVARDKNSRATPFAMNDLKRAPVVTPAAAQPNAASAAP